MAVSSVIAKSVLKVVWPWFLKHLWPVIVMHLADLGAKGLKRLADRILAAIRNGAASRSASADQKAREAEMQAQAASSHGEREKYEAIARVWREVAEQFRAENESLRQQIAEALAAQQTLAESEARALRPTLESRRTETVVVIGDKVSTVPALPNTLPPGH